MIHLHDSQIPTVSEYKTLFGLTVSPSKTSLTLKYVAAAPGPRIYLTTASGPDRYNTGFLTIIVQLQLSMLSYWCVLI